MSFYQGPKFLIYRVIVTLTTVPRYDFHSGLGGCLGSTAKLFLVCKLIYLRTVIVLSVSLLCWCAMEYKWEVSVTVDGTESEDDLPDMPTSKLLLYWCAINLLPERLPPLVPWSLVDDFVILTPCLTPWCWGCLYILLMLYYQYGCPFWFSNCPTIS